MSIKQQLIDSQPSWNNLQLQHAKIGLQSNMFDHQILSNRLQSNVFDHQILQNRLQSEVMLTPKEQDDSNIKVQESTETSYYDTDFNIPKKYQTYFKVMNEFFALANHIAKQETIKNKDVVTIQDFVDRWVWYVEKKSMNGFDHTVEQRTIQREFIAIKDFILAVLDGGYMSKRLYYGVKSNGKYELYTMLFDTLKKIQNIRDEAEQWKQNQTSRWGRFKNLFSNAAPSSK